MNKKFTLIILFHWVIIVNAFCNVCPGDVTLSTQAQIEAFQCTEVTGTLTISGDDITDLLPLHGLKAALDNPTKNLRND